MEKDGGVSFWPKPILHHAVSIGGSKQIDMLTISTCGHCNRGFYCNDIAVTSCKHCFHPFCLAEITRTTSRCAVCNLVFHRDWWRS